MSAMPTIQCLSIVFAFALFSTCSRPAEKTQQSKAAKFSLSQLSDELSSKVGQKRINQPPQAELSAISMDELIDEIRLRQKSIYGLDDRKDYGDMTSAIKGISASVASLWESANLTSTGRGTFQLQTVALNAKPRLCDNGGTLLCTTERFATQPTGAFCTGFVVADDLIATAGHCANPSEIDVNNIRFVFGFYNDSGGTVTEIPAQDVYFGASVERRIETAASDWALIRVKRKIQNHVRLALRLIDRIPDNSPVMILGHPTGLPLKFADGAAVRDNSPSAFFVANLDSFGGNSGSPVLSEAGGVYQVEGILVRGATDYAANGTCCKALVCPNTGCRGEDVTRTTEFAQYVPAP